MNQPAEEQSSVLVELTVEETLDAVEHAAELWGANWQREGPGGRLELPVVAGVRRGTLTARLDTESFRDQRTKGTLLSAQVEFSRYRLQTPAVTILVAGGLGGLALTLWPLYPPLLTLAPIALIFTVVAWLVVASRLQNSGLEEFFDLVQAAGTDAPADPRN